MQIHIIQAVKNIRYIKSEQKMQKMKKALAKTFKMWYNISKITKKMKNSDKKLAKSEKTGKIR